MNVTYRKHFRKALPILLSFLMGISLVALLIKSQDPLASYFNSETLGYLTFDANEGFLESEWYRRAVLGADTAVINEALHNLEAGSGRNVAAGLSIKDGGPKFLIAARFPESYDLQPLKEYLTEKNLAVALASKPAGAAKIFLVSNDGSMLADAVAISNGPSVHRINLSSLIWLNHPGTARINLDGLSRKTPELAGQMGGSQGPLVKWLTFGLSFSEDQGNIIISNTPLVNYSSIPVNTDPNLRTGFSLSSGPKQQVNVITRHLLQPIISAGGGYGLEQLISISRPARIDYFDYDQFNSSRLSLNWEGDLASAESFYSQAADLVENYLSEKNRRRQTVYLPDGSPIQTWVKNPKSFKVNTNDGVISITDLVGDDSYELERRADMVAISKNFDPKISGIQIIDGCPLREGDDYAVLDLQKWFFPNSQAQLGKLLILEGMGQGSTSYPQFSFCIH